MLIYVSAPLRPSLMPVKIPCLLLSPLERLHPNLVYLFLLAVNNYRCRKPARTFRRQYAKNRGWLGTNNATNAAATRAKVS